MNFKQQQNVFTFQGHIYSISDKVENGHRVIVKINEKTKQVVVAKIANKKSTVRTIKHRIQNDKNYFNNLPTLEGSETPTILH